MGPTPYLKNVDLWGVLWSQGYFLGYVAALSVLLKVVELSGLDPIIFCPQAGFGLVLIGGTLGGRTI